jgi:tetratricopeptide (TPR) repeat protein
MSKKNRQKQKLAHKQQQQKAQRPAARIQLAEEAFQTGDFEKAAATAELALRAAGDPPTQQRACTLIAAIALRRLSGKQPQAQLPLLTHVLALAPNDARLHYHHGLALARLGRFAEAATAFQAAAERQPNRPGLIYLQQLIAVATGKAVDDKALTEPQRATAKLLQQLYKTKSGEKSWQSAGGAGLPANTSELWSVLLQMYDSASSVPVATFAKASADPTVAANPVTTYYQGVLAMRQGKSEAAATAWDKASDQLATPWLMENLTNLRRERATTLAQAGDWPAVIDLFQQTREESATGEVDTVFGEIAGHAYFQLGFTAGQAGDWPKAYSSFKAANELLKNRWLSQNLALAAEACDEWNTAADAWREMVRRRPRKEDHPDYLSDAQVAAIWNRVTDCYIEAENPEEAISALKNALKYDEQNVNLRLKLADLLHSQDRIEATENELNRILEIDSNHVPALTRLGTLYTGHWERDPMPIWKRVLALEPKNEDARTALALLYVEQVDGDVVSPFAAMASIRRGKKTPVQILQEGLEQVPNHPILLVELARHTYTKEKDKPVARDYLMQAARAAPRDVRMMGAILHELLHADGGEQVRALTPQVRQIGGLRPSFWVNQGEQVLQCKLGADWAQFFWEQATATAQTMRGEDSPAAILLHIYDTADDHGEEALAERYASQLRKEHPKSGAVEYVDAVKLWRKDPQKTTPIVRLLEKAKSIAQKAGEAEIATMADDFAMGVKYPQRNSLFGSGNPFLDLMRGFDDDDDDLDDDDLAIDKDDLFNAFRRIFR